jgi:hypothetical protein
MFENWKCRCSAISKLTANSKENPPITEIQLEELRKLEEKPVLTDPQKLKLATLIQKRENSKNIVLSDTAIGYLVESYAWETAKKKSVSREMDITAFRKGKLCEQESIEMLSFVDNTVYQKNTERVENEFLSGEPDVFTGAAILEAVRVIDMKNTFDYPLFLAKITASIDKANRMQVQGYGDITGAKELQVAYALCNMPEIMRNDYKRKLFYQGEYISDESPDFLIKWNELERSMVFDEISPLKRIYKVPIDPFTETERDAVYDRVKIGRDWLCKFHEDYCSLNL